MSSSSKPGREGLLRALDDRNERVVPFSAWEKIDSAEKRLGSMKNKPREKLTTWEELLKMAMEWIDYEDLFLVIHFYPSVFFQMKFSLEDETIE